jgi:superfamily I DNA/RNA helicase
MERLTAIGAAPPIDLEALVDTTAGFLPASPELEAARAELGALARAYLSTDLAEFLTSIALRKEEEEAIVPNTVNIMTMHKAKGLDACVVFVAAAEHEVLVRNPADTNEARRLFYVSLSRAKRALFITHATRRTRLQAHSAAGGAVLQRARFLQTRGASRPGNQFANTFIVDPLLLQAEQPAMT